jgi:transcription initiation factor TFIIIB Brf1 subunit/transcription initiation factor TFIIB
MKTKAAALEALRDKRMTDMVAEVGAVIVRDHDEREVEKLVKDLEAYLNGTGAKTSVIFAALLMLAGSIEMKAEAA